MQYLLPQKTLTRLLAKIARIQKPWFKNWLIKRFISGFAINIDEAAEQNIDAYPDFQSFFCRALREDARPIEAKANAIVHPVDGRLCQFGQLTQWDLLQAKGKSFSCAALLGDAHRAETFIDGSYAIYYLSPSDYHRVHMPAEGRLTAMSYIPGKLFSVAPNLATQIDNLYARNERVVCHFDTEHGPMAVVLIGAMLVGSVYTSWHGVVNGDHGKQLRQFAYPNPKSEQPILKRGEELGGFYYGSSVIILSKHAGLNWSPHLSLGSPVKMGQLMAEVG